MHTLFAVLFLVSATLATEFESRHERSADPGCDQDGVHYEIGERVAHPDKCTRCVCHGRRKGVTCVMTQCAFPQCVDSVEMDDSCCRTCPNGHNCLIPNGMLRYGETWTESRGEYCNAVCQCENYRRHATCKLQCDFPDSEENESTEE